MQRLEGIIALFGYLGDVLLQSSVFSMYFLWGGPTPDQPEASKLAFT